MSGKLAGEQCTATAKGTGRRCARIVIGGGVCVMHGGNAPQVKAAREARIVAAEAALEAPRSAADAADVLTSAMNDSHSLLQRLKSNIADGRVTVADLTALGDWVDRAARISKLVVDAGIEERRTRVSEAQGQLLVVAIQQILDGMLQHLVLRLKDQPDAVKLVQQAWPALPGIVVPPVLRSVSAAPELPSGGAA